MKIRKNHFYRLQKILFTLIELPVVSWVKNFFTLIELLVAKPGEAKSHIYMAKAKTRIMKTTFTLIELLVVIAIIAILMTMLLPALRTAKDISKKAVCKSNLKQLGISMESYMGDHDSFLPKPKSTTTYGDTWDARLVEIIYGIEYLPGNSIADWVSAGGISLLYCPARKQKTVSAGGNQCKSRCYSMNLMLTEATTHYSPVKFSKLNSGRLSKILLLMDTGYVNLIGNKNSCSVGYSDAWHWKTGAGGPGALADYGADNSGFPHQKKANILFADFHIGEIPWQSAPTAQITQGGAMFW